MNRRLFCTCACSSFFLSLVSQNAAGQVFTGKNAKRSVDDLTVTQDPFLQEKTAKGGLTNWSSPCNGLVSGLSSKLNIGSIDLAKNKVRQDLRNFVEMEYERMCNLFEVRPHFSWYDDGKSPNAFAYSSSPVYKDGRPHVLIGVNLANSVMNQFRAKGDFASWIIVGVLAHEFGHILQFKMLSLGVKANHGWKYPDLHADFIAGFYINQRALDLAVTGQTDLNIVYKELLEKFYSIGDYQFNSPTHHGTGDERLRAVAGGVLAHQELTLNKVTFSTIDVYNSGRRFTGY